PGTLALVRPGVGSWEKLQLLEGKVYKNTKKGGEERAEGEGGTRAAFLGRLVIEPLDGKLCAGGGSSGTQRSNGGRSLAEPLPALRSETNGRVASERSGPLPARRCAAIREKRERRQFTPEHHPRSQLFSLTHIPKGAGALELS
ncbi:unnamed protein product, partial [Pleuronectes platessa]